MSVRNIIYSAAGQSDLRSTRLQFSQTAPVSYFGSDMAFSSDGNTLAVSESYDAGSVYVFTRNGSTWIEQVRLSPNDIVSGDSFGYVLALNSDGNTLAVSARFDDLTSPAAINGGSVYVFTRSGTTWTQQAKLQAADASGYDIFGMGVSLNSDGDTLAVGAYGNDLTSPAIVDAGSVYIFTRSGTTWTQQAQIQAADPSSSDEFGASVSLSADGNTLAVSARRDDLTSPAVTDAGSVYIFTRSGTTWTQQARLQAAEASSQGNAMLGIDIAISADGNTLAAGAYFADLFTGLNAGSVHVFTRSGTAWAQQVRLVASGAAADDLFGSRVAISANGSTIAVAAPYDDLTSPAAINGGSVYVFTRSGTAWTQTYRLQSSNVATNHRFGDSLCINGDGSILAVGTEITGVSGTGGVYVYYPAVPAPWSNNLELFGSTAQAGEFFGTSIGLSTDGNTIAVGANYDTVTNDRDGAAYIFQRTGSTWTQQARFGAASSVAKDFLGTSIAISGDSNTVAVGAPGSDSTSPAVNSSGAVYIFTRSGTTWAQQARLQASTPSDLEAFASYEGSLALSQDGNTLAVGAPSGSIIGDTSPGKVYVFTRSGTTWTQQTILQPASGVSRDRFGVSLDLSGDGNTIIIGAEVADTALVDTGAAYIFTRSGTTWAQQARLVASDAVAGDEFAETADYFGYAVAISSTDGNTVVIGSPYNDITSPAITNAGSVYVFTRSGTTWTQRAILQASDPSSTAWFGGTVDINANATTIVVGDPSKSTGVGANAGALYIFKQISTNNWVQQAIATKAYGPGSYSASSVRIDGGGSVVAAASQRTPGTSGARGSINIFHG